MFNPLIFLQMTREDLNYQISTVTEACKVDTFYVRYRNACGFTNAWGKFEDINEALDKIELVGGIGDNLPIEMIAFYSKGHANIYVEKEDYDYMDGYSFESHQHINLPYMWGGKFFDFNEEGE